MISINIYATLYGGMKLPAKYVPNSDAVTALFSQERVYCLSKDDVITKRELSLPTNTAKDRGHIIDFFQLILFFCYCDRKDTRSKNNK